MCGIIGYKGSKNAIEIVLNGLKRLEYRGYDSWGIASKEQGKINVAKKVGKIGAITTKDTKLNPSGLAIGHTRWATTGRVSEENAHPHLSMDNKIAVVHNGIVENYQELRDELKKKGYKFKSETDTEVIPMLIQEGLSKGISFRDALLSALKRIEGSFAVVAINTQNNEIGFGRRGSPLVLGIGEGEFFVASDIPAFLEHSNKVIYLNDDEYGIISDKIEVFDVKSNKPLKKEIVTINWNLEQAKKGNYPHYMLKEMTEQKFTIKKAIEQDAKLIEKVADKIRKADKVFFAACGTSYHASLNGAYMFLKNAGVMANVVIASEMENYAKTLTKKSVVIAVSQSGETADLLDAVKTAKQRGAITISIVNVMGSSLTRSCDLNIMMNAGPEICVLSTKSYTSQVAIVTLLSYALDGKTNEGKKKVEMAANEVPSVIDTNLKNLKALAAKIKNNTSMFLIGRDLAYPSALEGALKVKEVSYIHAEGFAGAELKHGTIALIDKGTPAITISNDSTRQLILSNAAEIKARGGYIIGIDSRNNEIFDYFIQVPELGDANPLVQIIPIQILAYYLALERKCDPDKPRNLAKSVTVK